MDEDSNIKKIKTWIKSHPKELATGIVVSTGVVGFIMGRELQNALFNRWMTALEDSIQAGIEEFGKQEIKVTKQGYHWIIKNAE